MALQIQSEQINAKTVVNEELIRKHLPLVHRMARQMAMRTSAEIGADDLMSAGSMGLLDSVIRNRGDEGASFACYVRMRIRGAIYDELRANNWLPRRNRSTSKNESTDGPARPSAVIRFDDLPKGAESNPENLEKGTNPHQALSDKRIRQHLLSALDMLPSRDRLVLHLHYFKEMQIREIGRLLGVSEARISQIHHRALSRIRPILTQAA